MKLKNQSETKKNRKIAERRKNLMQKRTGNKQTKAKTSKRNEIKPKKFFNQENYEGLFNLVSVPVY
jgi:hypothetical protein